MNNARIATYGADRVDAAGQAEHHTATRSFGQGRAWKEDLDAQIPDDRVWVCEKSGVKFVEDEEAKVTEVAADLPLSDALFVDVGAGSA